MCGDSYARYAKWDFGIIGVLFALGWLVSLIDEATKAQRGTSRTAESKSRPACGQYEKGEAASALESMQRLATCVDVNGGKYYINPRLWYTTDA